jgi:hypothetical protein
MGQYRQAQIVSARSLSFKNIVLPPGRIGRLLKNAHLLRYPAVHRLGGVAEVAPYSSTPPLILPPVERGAGALRHATITRGG